MSKLWIPGAVHKPLHVDPSRDPVIDPTPGDIFHIAVSEAASLFNNFHDRPDGIESTGYIRRDGTIEQYRPLNIECDAQGDGNSFTFNGHRGGFNSWETQGGEFGEWTNGQVASIKRIIAFKHTNYGTPLRLCPGWNEAGFGYHRLHDRWNKNGHTCPGPDRVKQFHAVIVPWMKTAGKPKEPQMNDVQQGRVELGAMLRAGDKAMTHFAGVDHHREAVVSFRTTLRETLRILRAAEKNLPEK